jgi:hypothetical protein
VESLGGIQYTAKHQLHILSERATGVSAVDRTRYKRAPSCRHTFMQHHSQRISKAAVMADAAAICKKIDALKQQACLISRHPISPDFVVA